MKSVEHIAALRAQLGEWRQQGARIALVPTMGNLHAGHMRLVDEAKAQAQRVVVTIFVNPLQFGVNEDIESYPRTLVADSKKLDTAGVDLLFAPSVTEVYPQGASAATRIEVPEVSEGLCGDSRPGHFVGVATVVAKLFNMVQPDVALFGQKDYQQLAVIRRMVDDLCFPIKIVGVPTVRERDGLAMSSRNSYLSPQERALAPLISNILNGKVAAIRDGMRDFSHLEAEALIELEAAGFRPDYFRVCNRHTLKPATREDQELVVLVAAWVGAARLIDNQEVWLEKGALSQH